MKVYVIRHGESKTNYEKKWTGWLDVNLTEKGMNDAKKAGEFLASVSFDKIYSSDLLRARQTAENAIVGCRYETSELLREINVGSLAGKPLSVVTAEKRKELGTKRYIEYGGESQKEFLNRVTSFMRELEDKNYENVAVFSHAGWLRQMLDNVIGVNIPRNKICCNNCTVAVFEYTGEEWRLYSWVNLT